MAAAIAQLPTELRAELRAERITPDTAATLDVGGPDAIGGIGDWWLANDQIEAVIDDVSRAHAKSNHGGTLVDLGLRDRRDEDQFARLIPLINLSQRVVAGYDAIRSELDESAGAARVIVTSSGLQPIQRGGWFARRFDPLVPAPDEVDEVRLRTVYELRRGESFLRIVTTLENRGADPAPVFAFGDLWMRGGRSGRGFVGDLLAPEQSQGFEVREMSPSLSGSRGAFARFTHLALVGSAGFPPIAYGYAAPERAARGMPLFGMMGEHASLALAFVGDPALERLSLASLARSLFRKLEPGERWSFERRVYVGGRREVSGLTDALRAALELPQGTLRGSFQLGAGAGVVLIETPNGASVTQLALPDFSAQLAPGSYVARLRVAHAPEQRLPFGIREGEETRIAFENAPAASYLLFDPAFADAGAGRIEVRGVGETPDPIFADDLLGATLDGAPLPSATASSSLLFVGNATDPGEVQVTPGRYVLYATRGIDWEIAQQSVVVAAPGARVRVAPFELVPLDPLPGYVTADLHVHAEASDDSQSTNEDRLRRFVAEGLEVLVATDHDHVANYAPALARLALGARLRVVSGVEVTSSTPSPAAPWTIGHHNAWPIPYVAEAHRDGAPPSQNRSAGQLYAELRRDHGARVLQLNHPRAGSQESVTGEAGHFFEHLGVGRRFDPRHPEQVPEGSLAFDALEVMNGASWERFLVTRNDWLELLRRGLRRTATANSDSHAPDELIGYPRNYVFVGEPGDDPLRFDTALLGGRSFGTTGPRLRRFRVNGASLGELAVADSGRVSVDFEVEAASWVPLDEVRILLNGRVVHAARARSGTLDLLLDRDAFLHLEAGASLDVDAEAWRKAHPGLYTEVFAPGFVSAAFTNPVFVDVDGNQRFDPPDSQ